MFFNDSCVSIRKKLSDCLKLTLKLRIYIFIKMDSLVLGSAGLNIRGLSMFFQLN